MFERFTDRARRVVVLAQEEARTRGGHYVETQDVLTALLVDGGRPRRRRVVPGWVHP